MPTNPKIIELRAKIQKHASAPAAKARAVLPTGVGALDELLEGGLLQGGITELQCGAKTGGVSSLMHAIMGSVAAQGHWMALIDGADSFDPRSVRPNALKSLLWIRSHSAGHAVTCADMLFQDGNLPLIFLDLRGNSAAELAKIPSTTWYRFQRTIEPTSVALIVLTPKPIVACSEIRLSIEGKFCLDDLDLTPEEIVSRLELRVARKRLSGVWPPVVAAGSSAVVAS